MAPQGEQLQDRRAFWTEYQPGFRSTTAEVGTPEFFQDVDASRYRYEPHIPEMARFADWADRDVLEAGCGMATDGMRFARAGARYTGMDFSATALELAQRRFELEGLEGRFVRAAMPDLPFDDASFDLVYSNGVIHHLPQTEDVVRQFHRILRPGGTAIVMLYHRASFNYHVSIMAVKRALAALLLLPDGPARIAKLTGEPVAVLEGQRQLLSEHGLSYLRDRALFLSHNTDGPGNPLSKVYSRSDAGSLFRDFAEIRTTVRFLNLRNYPGGNQLQRTKLGRRLEGRWGWHLWIEARKAA